MSHEATASSSNPSPQAEPEQLEIELRDPRLAAFLAWLFPGVGHFYQGRYGKGALFLVCIMGTYLFGMYLGGGKVVYASMRSGDRRLPYLCQVGVGLPALPALVQTYRVRQHKQPLWGGFMAPPADEQELAAWHKKLARFFELGTAYTMIAGLLNVLAIYDAWGGPLLILAHEAAKQPPPKPAESGG